MNSDQRGESSTEERPSSGLVHWEGDGTAELSSRGLTGLAQMHTRARPVQGVVKRGASELHRPSPATAWPCLVTHKPGKGGFSRVPFRSTSREKSCTRLVGRMPQAGPTTVMKPSSLPLRSGQIQCLYERQAGSLVNTAFWFWVSQTHILWTQDVTGVFHPASAFLLTGLPASRGISQH